MHFQKGVKAVFDEYYGAHSEDYTKPYEGIQEALTILNAKGIQCAVLTNKAQVYATELIKRQFKDQIAFVMGQREGVPTKPNPIGIYDLIKKFDVQKEACIYMGDSDIDMLTAKNAGVTSIGVLWGFRTKEELLNAGAHHLAEKPEELVKLILDNPK